MKYDPNRFGRRRLKPPRRREINPINIGELDERVERLLADKKAKKTRGGISVDLNHLGYDKLLGKGKVTHQLIVKVKSASRFAAEKIEKAGGRILCPT